MKFLLLLAVFFFTGCRTIDVESQARNKNSLSLGSLDPVDNIDENAALLDKETILIENTIIELTPEPVILEKPVYVPAQAAAPVSPKEQGREAAASANAAGTRAPLSSDFTSAALVYDYHPDWVYEVYASPSRVTDICLEENETPLEAPFVSDSDRWILGGGKNMSGASSIAHIYVKPKETGLTASMIINTDRRSYHILLRSYAETYMPVVRWQYKLYFSDDFFTPQKKAGAAVYANNNMGSPVDISHEILAVDPRFLSFDYKIIYSLWSKPPWLPRLVYDDGKKTYITFKEGILQNEFPAIFENRNDIVNYRVSANLVIIDKLIEKITVKLGKRKVIIEKKKGA
jgi:type IV secretion system protein VirB9